MIFYLLDTPYSHTHTQKSIIEWLKLKLGTLGSPIEFKRIVALTNEIKNNVIFSNNI